MPKFPKILEIPNKYKSVLDFNIFNTSGFTNFCASLLIVETAEKIKQLDNLTLTWTGFLEVSP